MSRFSAALCHLWYSRFTAWGRWIEPGSDVFRPEAVAVRVHVQAIPVEQLRARAARGAQHEGEEIEKSDARPLRGGVPHQLVRPADVRQVPVARRAWLHRDEGHRQAGKSAAQPPDELVENLHDLLRRSPLVQIVIARVEHQRGRLQRIDDAGQLPRRTPPGWSRRNRDSPPSGPGNRAASIPRAGSRSCRKRPSRAGAPPRGRRPGFPPRTRRWLRSSGRPPRLHGVEQIRDDFAARLRAQIALAMHAHAHRARLPDRDGRSRAWCAPSPARRAGLCR